VKSIFEPVQTMNAYFEATTLVAFPPVTGVKNTVWRQKHCLAPKTLSGAKNTVWRQKHCLAPKTLSGAKKKTPSLDTALAA
jgi:hypothetical protein